MFCAENELYFALRQIFPELKVNLLRNVNWKNKIKSNEVSNFLKNTTFFSDSYLLLLEQEGSLTLNVIIVMKHLLTYKFSLFILKLIVN